MHKKTPSRWVQALGLYSVPESPSDFLLVMPDHRGPTEPPFRKRTPNYQVSDERLLDRFLAFSRSSTSLGEIARFTLKYGAFSFFGAELPEVAAQRFGQVKRTFDNQSVELYAGTGYESLTFGGEIAVLEVATFTRLARFMSAILTLHRALGEHGQIPWTSFSRKKAIAAARWELISAGFEVQNIDVIAAMKGAGPPADTDYPEADALALHLAKHGGEDFEQYLLSPTNISVELTERNGGISARNRGIASRVHEWRRYWQTIELLESGWKPSAAQREAVQRDVDSMLVSAAAAWCVDSAKITLTLVNREVGFVLEYAPITLWQSLMLALGQQLVRAGTRPLSQCRNCAIMFISRVGARGGRPRTLCELCYDQRLSKTISERKRRSGS